MLILYGLNTEKQKDMPGIILSPASYFNMNYQDSWFEGKFCRDMITDISGIDVTDNSKSVKNILAEEGITIDRLPTGLKNLFNCMFCAETKRIHRLSMMGENCFYWLMLISKLKDVSVVTGIAREFLEDDINGGKIYFPDIDFVATDEKTYRDGLLKLLALGVM